MSLGFSLLTCNSGFQLQAQLEKVRTELETQSQHAARLESSCRALDCSLGQSSETLQVSSESAYYYHYLFWTPKPEHCQEFKAPLAAQWGGCCGFI